MAVVGCGVSSKPFVDNKISQRKVMLFSRSYDPECKRIKSYLDEYKMSPQIYEVAEIECRQDVTQIENYFQIICLTDSRAVPQLFVDGKYAGGEKEITRNHESGKLKEMLKKVGAIPNSA
ncbi:glutaredoxin [Lingula anatina]|uniref:Glutaredoxin n=1 Tax=Lingula anatina TaxID=7574 RepID=A0A1S3HK46_LINAN|nr:glutaredoxin-like [Lingula anatina]XP_013386407.1 glutaredoxin [Lingula anatina]|eukprot:XP_013386392.1 glutaredoxin-like [Lingula anatina]